MIVFEVRSDGTVISTPSFVAQGISLSDLVVLADADYSLVTMHFTPPSGIYIPDVVFTPTLTQGRNLWQAVMPPEISMISGAVTYQIFLTSADGKTLPTPTGRITVQEGVISNMPETAEELGQYSISALYQLMSNFYASLEGYRQTLDGLTVKTHKWTILASDWTDSTPYQASIVFPHGNYAKPGTLILVAPADNRSREQIEKGGLTVTVLDNGVIGDVPFVDTAVIVRGGKAPTEDINLVLFFLDTQGEDEPLTQWIGIDMGSILPEVTPEDDGKVLGVDGGVWQKVKIEIPDPLPPILPENESDTLTVEGGTTVWKKPEKGMSVTEITSPEEITADSPDGLYIQEGGSSAPSGGTTIHYYDSLDSVPADLPEGSFVAVPVNDEVVDLSGVFDYATSLEQFGEVCTVNYDCTELVARFKKGGVPVKVSVGGMVSETTVFASTNANTEFAQFNHLANLQGVLFVFYTQIGGGVIQYSCKQVDTSPYIPGD